MRLKIWIALAMLLLVFLSVARAPAQSMTWAGKWRGIVALPVAANDPIGTPGELTLVLEEVGGKLRGRLEDSFLRGELVQVVIDQTKVRPLLLAKVRDPDIPEKPSMEFRLFRDGDWLWGVLKFYSEVNPGVDFMRVYLKRQK